MKKLSIEKLKVSSFVIPLSFEKDLNTLAGGRFGMSDQNGNGCGFTLNGSCSSGNHNDPNGTMGPGGDPDCPN